MQQERQLFLNHIAPTTLESMAFPIRRAEGAILFDNYDNKFIDYHIEFFRAGLNAIIKKWLNNGCKESPEEINEIITSEYKNKN